VARHAVLVLSQYVEVSYADDLLADGRAGRLPAQGPGQRPRRVPRRAAAVADGGTALDPEVIERLMVRRRDPMERLTPREREVLGQMAQGKATRQSPTTSW
jgi:DNA-binding NarL/FixJ family response regulator